MQLATADGGLRLGHTASGAGQGCGHVARAHIGRLDQSCECWTVAIGLEQNGVAQARQARGRQHAVLGHERIALAFGLLLDPLADGGAVGRRVEVAVRIGLQAQALQTLGVHLGLFERRHDGRAALVGEHGRALDVDLTGETAHEHRLLHVGDLGGVEPQSLQSRDQGLTVVVALADLVGALDEQRAPVAADDLAIDRDGGRPHVHERVVGRQHLRGIQRIGAGLDFGLVGGAIAVAELVVGLVHRGGELRGLDHGPFGGLVVVADFHAGGPTGGHARRRHDHIERVVRIGETGGAAHLGRVGLQDALHIAGVHAGVDFGLQAFDLADLVDRQTAVGVRRHLAASGLAEQVDASAAHRMHAAAKRRAKPDVDH